jgi:hypothetical protein
VRREMGEGRWEKGEVGVLTTKDIRNQIFFINI